MNGFEEIIGYENVKEELLQLLDIINNRGKYEKLGAKMPRGILLEGKSGLGKTMLCEAFIKESGVRSFTVRRRSVGEDFTNVISKTFENARESTPAIVFLDDMDKFANEEENRSDAPEYIAVQAGFDDCKDYDVFVIATVNKAWKLPDSLLREGRFDRKVKLKAPKGQDAIEIIRYFLQGKKVETDINIEDLLKMTSSGSCAQLETAFNEAAIYAGYENCENVKMKHIVRAVLRMHYNSGVDYRNIPDDEKEQKAIHEAGHLVAAEAIKKGSIGMASILGSAAGEEGGFVHLCEEIPRRPQHVMIGLAGKAAVEMYYGGRCASGCQSDLSRVISMIRDGITESGTLGLSMHEMTSYSIRNMSDSMNARNEAVTTAELERIMFKTKEVLIDNREFLEKVRDALMEKGTLLYSDIQEIEDTCNLVMAPEV